MIAFYIVTGLIILGLIVTASTLAYYGKKVAGLIVGVLTAVVIIASMIIYAFIPADEKAVANAETKRKFGQANYTADNRNVVSNQTHRTTPELPDMYGGPDGTGITITIPPRKCSPTFDTNGEREKDAKGDYLGAVKRWDLRNVRGEPVKYQFRATLLSGGDAGIIIDGNCDKEYDFGHPIPRHDREMYRNRSATEDAIVHVEWVRKK